MFKNQLQELAQRSCFNLPSYACIREGPDHAPRFKATVNFNGETFDSPNFCNTLRQAEHAAAEVALIALAKRGPSRSLAARVLDETGVYKNLLQETAHRAGLDLPVYTTIRSGPGHTPVFTCTVELAGMSFLGDPAKTKKQAQKNSAMAAWSALKQLPNISSSSSSLESENKEEQEQVIIARALANMHSANGNRLILNDKKYEPKQPPAQKETSAAARTPLYSSPRYQSWLYSNLNPEVGIYPTWNQEQFIHQQSQFLTLPTLPPNDPRNFPLIQSIQPMQGQYFPVLEQDPLTSVPFYQESASNSYLDLTGYPLHATRSRSQVSIQEIREGKSEVEEKERFHNVSSDAEVNHREQKPDPLSCAASISQVEGSNLNLSAVKSSDSEHSQKDKKANDSLHITEMPSEGDSSVGNPSIQPVIVHPHMSSVHGSMNGRKHTQKSQRMAKNTFTPHIQSYSNFKTQTHEAFDSTQPAADVHTPAMASSVLPPHMIGTATGFSIPSYGSGHGIDILRPSSPLMAAPVTMRTAVPVFSARNTTAYLNSCIPRAMAPAVHVRSVAPVCSAPSSHAPAQTKIPENQGTSRTASEFSRLHL